MRVTNEFYKKSALELAPELIGKLLCRRVSGKTLKYRITETECYYGEDDTACHAHKGKTNRTAILYGAGGRAYVYLCYGIHNLLNVVTGEEGFPEAVLIRGVEGFPGPGRLTKSMGIDRDLNGECLITSDRLWIEDDGYRMKYTTGKRVGIDYATEEYKNKPWRFIAEEYI
jgi:DNA-3-methyladenine glycosylase